MNKLCFLCGFLALALLAACTTAAEPLPGQTHCGAASVVPEQEPGTVPPAIVFEEAVNVQALTGATGQGSYMPLFYPGARAEILYFDFETAARQFLMEGEQRVCVEGLYGGAELFTIGGKLYLLQLGGGYLAQAMGEEGYARVYQLELDGTGLRELACFNVTESFWRCAFAYDGEWLYFMLLQYYEGDHAAQRLVRLHTQTGELENLQQFEAEARYHIQSAFVGGSLCLGRWAQGGEGEEWSLLLLDVATGEQTPLPAWLARQGISCEGELIYCWDEELNTAGVYNLRTGQYRLLTDALNEDAERPICSSYGVRGGYMLFETRDEAGLAPALFGIDVETGEKRHCTLLAGRDSPAIIEAETEAYYMVYTGRITLPMRDYAPDGSYIIVNSTGRQYALIAKEDYWNSTPSYVLKADCIP